MTTTSQDALIKIRRQIANCEKKLALDPNSWTVRLILNQLKSREDYHINQIARTKP